MDALTHISCPNCGAQVEIKPGQLTLKCDYCDTDIPLVKPKEETPLQVEFMVPVGVDNTKLTSFAHDLMIKPETVPDDILDKSQIEELGFFYVPCYMGQGRFECHWSASFGFDRQEPYTDYENQIVNGKTRRVAVTRYRTVTDWRPASGTGSGKFLRLICATSPDALDLNVAKMVQNTVAYNPIVYDQSLMGGYSGLDFAYSPDQATSALETIVQQEDATFFAYKRAQGQHQRDWSIDAMVTFDRPVTAGFIPLAKFVFSYNGKNYTIWAEGTGLSAYLNDPMPVDSGRSSKKSKGYIPFWMTLLAAVSCSIMVASDIILLKNIWPMSAALVFALIFGKWRSSSISGYSRRLREASLAAKKLELTDSTSPLPDEERRQLLDKSQPPVKPFMAKTDNDGRRLLIVTLICVIVGIFFSFGLKTSPSQRSSTSSTYRTSSAQPTPDNSPSTYTAPTTTAPDNKPPDNSSSANTPPAPSLSEPQKRDLPPDPVGGPYNLANLDCNINMPPDYCQSLSGDPVSGLVYTYSIGPSGKADGIFYISRYRDGRPDGPTVFFDKPGSITMVQNYRQGNRYGLFFTLHEAKSQGEEQKIKILAPLENGQTNGTLFTFDENGNLKAAAVFVDDLPDGLITEYYSDGSVKAKSKYSQGSPVGTRQTYEKGQFFEDMPIFTKADLFNEILTDANQIMIEASKLQSKL